MIKEHIIEKIENRGARVGIIGLGYVGLPLSVEAAKAGFRTVGFDLQTDKVEMVARGENYIGDIADSELSELVAGGLLSATTDFSKIGDMDFVAICVPTPIDRNKQPDLSYVEDSGRQIARYMKRGCMVVLESTTYPGTTEELLKPILEQGSGLKCGADFYLGFSPERVDPGNAVYKTKNTPKVVGAIGGDALEVISHMYETILESEVFRVSSPAVAEMEKILENTYRNVNIGLVNEFAMLCSEMNISIWEVVEAAKTKPYGFKAFYPGPGIGGHCIPLDPCYLSWKAKEYNFHTSMIESSMRINDKMPSYCVDRIGKILNRSRLAINGSKLLVSGVAYKKDIDDYRESPSLEIIRLLESEGAEVEFYDPLIPEYEYRGVTKKGITSLKREDISRADLVVIATGHSGVDYGMIAGNAKFIFDTKNVLKNLEDRGNIELL